MDATSLDEPRRDYAEGLEAGISGLRVGVVREAFGEGRRTGRAGERAERDRPPRRTRRRGRRGHPAAHRLRALRVLPDRPVGGLVEPGAVRRRPVRAARRRLGLGRDDDEDPRRGLRRRGQAPDHARHVRAVGRLLRGLLRPGAEGPNADHPRLRARVRRVRRPRLAHVADHGVPDRRASGRPDGDVPLRRVHDPGQPVRDAGDHDPERSRRARAAGRGAAHRAGPPGGAAAAGGLGARAGDRVRRPSLRSSPNSPPSTARVRPGSPDAEPTRSPRRARHRPRPAPPAVRRPPRR